MQFSVHYVVFYPRELKVRKDHQDVLVSLDAT